MSATRARDLVESHPYNRDSYTKHDPRMDDPEYDNEYMTHLATIQILLDRINAEWREPNPVDILTLRQISQLAMEASAFKDTK